MSQFPPRIVVPATCLLVLAALSASADIDVQLGNGDKVTGTLDPPGEVEAFRVLLPAGAELSVTTKGKKSKAAPGVPVPRLRVVDELDADIAAGVVTQAAKGEKVTKLPIPVTAEYRIEVTGDGVTGGDYLMKVKWKARKKVQEDVDLSGGDATVDFSAEAGALVTFKVKAKDGTIPRLVSFEDADQTVLHEFGAGKAETDVAAKIPITKTADYSLLVSDDGGTGGTATVKITVKPPKTTKSKLGLSAKELGDGGGTAQGAVIGADGGAIAVPSDDASGIGGAALDVPAGALTRPQSLIVGTAEPFDGAPADGLNALGPAVSFGPSGVKFNADATITLPFSPDRLDGDAGDVVVGRRDSKGRITQATGQPDVDLGAGTVTARVSGFSSYAVFGPAPPPVRRDFNGDGKGDLIILTHSFGDDLGVVSVFFGQGGTLPPLPTSSDDADAVFVQSTPPNDRFASDWTDGDWNADGFTDLAIAEFQFGAGAAQTGRVYVFFGGPGFAGSTDPATDADVILTGTHSLGVSLGSGDVDGDGTDDLIASERDSARGKVRIFQGADDFAARQREIATITGSAIAQELGDQVAVGDVIGDGNADVVVTALANDDELPFVVVYDGSLLTGDLGPGDADVTLTGDHPVLQDVYTRPAGGLFVAEISGDQKEDIVFLSEQNTPFLRTIHAFRGGVSLVDTPIESSPIRIADHTPGSLFIRNFTVGNSGGDAASDIVVIATNGVLRYTGGAATFGGPGGPSYTVQADWASQIHHSAGTLPFGFGSRVLLHDVFGDDSPELIVTDPTDSTDAAQAGAAYLFFTDLLPANEQGAATTIRGNGGDGFGE